jgi:hypothetical protein
MSSDKLSANQEYVNSKKETLFNLNKNKYILVYDQQVVGSFDSYDAAAEEGIKAFGTDGSFLVHYLTEINPVNFISAALL